MGIAKYVERLKGHLDLCCWLIGSASRAGYVAIRSTVISIVNIDYTTCVSDEA